LLQTTKVTVTILLHTLLKRSPEFQLHSSQNCSVNDGKNPIFIFAAAPRDRNANDLKFIPELCSHKKIHHQAVAIKEDKTCDPLHHGRSRGGRTRAINKVLPSMHAFTFCGERRRRDMKITDDETASERMACAFCTRAVNMANAKRSSRASE
jgi:hypothetical protein